MTPAARYQATIELWSIIDKARIPMDSVCGDYFRTRRYIGSKDRANIAERVYNMMRAYARLGWWADKIGLHDDPRGRVLLTACLIDGHSADDLSNLFNGKKYHPDSLSEAEEQKLSSFDFNTDEEDRYLLNHPDMPESVLYECPEHAYDRLKALWGDDFISNMQAMMEPATLDIRVNTIKTTRDAVQQSLTKDDIQTSACPYSPVGLRLHQKSYLAKSKAFRKGEIEIQDEGSQLLTLICGAREGMQVLDYCAGGGGKTLGLAADMKGKGRIVAMDLHEKRLAKAKPRLTRADVHNVELRPLSDAKHTKWLRRQKEKFDVVLVDAPCTSSGTWRRNPDLKWFQYGPSADDIQRVQSEIIDRVHPYVKIGGLLVYATCSVFCEENENQIDEFLKSHDNFELVAVPQAWTNANINAPCPVDGNYLRLSPATHNTDGFFAAILQRVA